MRPMTDTMVAQLSMPISASRAKASARFPLGLVLVAEEPGDDRAEGPGEGGG